MLYNIYGSGCSEKNCSTTRDGHSTEIRIRAGPPDGYRGPGTHRNITSSGWNLVIVFFFFLEIARQVYRWSFHANQKQSKQPPPPYRAFSTKRTVYYDIIIQYNEVGCLGDKQQKKTNPTAGFFCFDYIIYDDIFDFSILNSLYS